MRREGVATLVWGQRGYPAAFLRGMSSPPLVLYLKGDPGALVRESVAIVGTRRPTLQGARIARRLGRDLGGTDLAIVSGLAAGIDGEAHRGCLDANGVTVAVLAHGLHTVQPPGHRALARAILDEGGALISEYPLGVEARRHTFVPRNRLIAGLAEATVVVEGGERSGARHSAEFASDYDRVVLAVPGRPSDPQAALPNLLLRERRAEVCRDAADVLASLRPDLLPAVRRAIDHRAAILARQAERAMRSLGEDARALLQAMGTEPAHVDALCARTGMEAAAVLTMLLRMEMENLVEELPGMRWLPNYRPPSEK
jgi:DNA processing protein